ncbi:MAG: SRPBCC family protein [Chitinophagaceae bacterium]|nr:SRPBCC family protein [Chitinophagaceae bacterium]
MSATEPIVLTVEVIVAAPVNKVWQQFTLPEHIIHWSNASDDWHTPHAENDLKVGGKFLSRMEARDGSFGFDFWGVYDVVEDHKAIEYTIGDGRKVKIHFLEEGNNTKVTEQFEAETTHPIEVQQVGWKAILDNFKKYVEGKS